MITITFWNTKGQPDPGVIASLVDDTASDIIILAEMGPSPVEVLTALNRSSTSFNFAASPGNTKLHLFVRFAERLITPVYETSRLTVRAVSLPGINPFLLAAVHFPSKYAWDEASQAAECSILATDLREAERIAGHQQTVLVGDLNMNPFENGMVSAAGLHAVMARSLAERGSRIVQGREYTYFYNPMWSFLGDLSQGPPGTFYHPRSEHRVYFWNVFDQVLVRPALLDRFSGEDVEVVTRIGGRTLLNAAGTPDSGVGSDHLPIRFRIS